MTRWRIFDDKCGSNYPLHDGTPTECDPDGKKPCCSKNGACGFTADYCTCDGCADYRYEKWRKEGKEEPLQIKMDRYYK